jgi:hypothetical protein
MTYNDCIGCKHNNSTSAGCPYRNSYIYTGSCIVRFECTLKYEWRK